MRVSPCIYQSLVQSAQEHSKSNIAHRVWWSTLEQITPTTWSMILLLDLFCHWCHSLSFKVIVANSVDFVSDLPHGKHCFLCSVGSILFLLCHVLNGWLDMSTINLSSIQHNLCISAVCILTGVLKVFSLLLFSSRKLWQRRYSAVLWYSFFKIFDGSEWQVMRLFLAVTVSV